MAKKIGAVLSVGAIAYIIYIFAFYIEGEMGAALIIFGLAAPLLSLITAIAARNRVKVSIDSDAFVKKGAELSLRIAVEKKGFFPFAIVEIVPAASEVFVRKKLSFRLSMIFADRKEFVCPIETRVGGNGEISIADVYSSGFLGFIRFKAKNAVPEPISVGVIPDIPDVKSSSQLVRQVANVVMTSDDEEENDSALMFSANSTPGYEHREYIPGDPLKRVDWKLSVKRDKLMVRLDEAVTSVQPLIILDLYRDPAADTERAVYDEEKTIRSAFGLLKVLAKQAIPCSLAYCGGGDRVVVESVENPDCIDGILLKVLSVKVVPGYRLDVRNIGDKSPSCVIATTDPFGSFSQLNEILGGTEFFSVIVPGPLASKPVENIWFLDENNDFKQV